MEKVAIVIETWKLSIFNRHLSLNGYLFEKHAGIAKDTLVLKLSTTNLEALAVVVGAASIEAKETVPK